MQATAFQARGVLHGRLRSSAFWWRLMMSILTHVLVPASLEEIKEARGELSQNVTAKLLTGRHIPAFSRRAALRFISARSPSKARLRDVYLIGPHCSCTVIDLYSRPSFLNSGQ